MSESFPWFDRQEMEYVRTLEEAEGISILTQWECGGTTYVCKYATAGDLGDRFLLVKSTPESIEAYLSGKVPMLELLSQDATCYLLDRHSGMYWICPLQSIFDVPTSYLPSPTAFHDPSLRDPNGD